MKHKVRISVSDRPQEGGVLTCRNVGIRERILKLLLGDRRKVTVLVPGDSKEKFVRAFNEMYDDRELVLDCCRDLMEKCLDTSDIEEAIDQAVSKCEVIRGLTEKLLEQNASQPMDQEEFRKKYDSYVEEYEKKRQRIENLKQLKAEKNGKANQLSAFMFEIHEREAVIDEFDEKLWITSIEKVTVNHDGSLAFRFRNGMEVTK